MSNPNLFIVTTDWHITSSDSETGGLGETLPGQALAISRYLNSFGAAGIVNLGDDKDHYGSETGDELDNFKTNVYNVLNWASVNGGVTALKPTGPGNHDEIADYTDEAETDFSLWNARFWSSPYHWTCDWSAPQVRFIFVHAYVIHAPDANAGFFQMDASEVTWLTAELAALPVGWKAFICSHPALAPALGNEVHDDFQGTELRALLAANAAKLVGCLGGHRHTNGASATLSTIKHLSCPGMSYTADNAAGGFILLEYNGTDTITAHMRTGPGSLLGGHGSYTPVTFSI